MQGLSTTRFADYSTRTRPTHSTIFASTPAVRRANMVCSIMSKPALRFYFPPSPGYIPCSQGHVFYVADNGKPQPGAPCLCGQRTYGQVELERTIGEWRVDMVRRERWYRWTLVALGVVLGIVMAVRW